MADAYLLAQDAMEKLRFAIFLKLKSASDHGLTNAEIGRGLGIYSGHVGHEGHVSRTLPALMQAEGVVEQGNENKRWRLRNNTSEPA